MQIEIPDRAPNLDMWTVLVKVKDNFTCQQCNFQSLDAMGLYAHHVIPARENKDIALDVANGITLCADCHRNSHNQRLSPETISLKLNIPLQSIIELLECGVLKGRKSETSGQWIIKQGDFIKFLKSPI